MGLKFILFIFFLVNVVPTASASDSLSYSGRLVNASGAPVPGPVNLRFELAYSNQLGLLLCSQDLNGVMLSQGVFHAKLDFPDCDLNTILKKTPANNNLMIRVVDKSSSNPTNYSFQAIHSVPFSFMAQLSKQLVQMDATDGQVLTWTSGKWQPMTPVIPSAGTMKSLSVGDGLYGGTITEAGIIGIQDGGVTAAKLHQMDAAEGQVLKWIGGSWVPAGDSGITTETDPFVLPFARTGLGAITPEICDTSQALQFYSPDQSLRCVDVVKNEIDPTKDKLAPSQKAVHEALADKQDKITTSSEVMMKSLRLTSDGTSWVDVKAPNPSGNYSFTLPAVAGSNGQYLKNTGSGVLIWDTPAVGSANITAGSISDTHISSISTSKITGLDGQLSALAGVQADYVKKDGTVAMAADLNLGNKKIIGLANPTNDQDAATMKYVDDKAATVASKWTKNANDIFYDLGNVGIGTNPPTKKLDVAGDIQVSAGSDICIVGGNCLSSVASSTADSTNSGVLSASDWNIFNNKQDALTTGTAAQYLRGNLTLGTFGTDVANSVLNNFAVGANTSVTDSDSVETAIEKLQGQMTATKASIPAPLLNTDGLAEGFSNLYFTEKRAIDSPLTGLSVLNGADVGSGDSILEGIGKLQAQMNLADLDRANYVLKAGDSMSGSLGIGGSANSSAMLDIQSTSKGFLPPRMTTAQRNAITTPATGLVIYNTSNDQIEFFNGSGWSTSNTFVGTRVTSNNSQAGNNTILPLNFNGKTFDVGNNFDLTTDRFQPTVAGKYLIHLQVNALGQTDGAHNVAHIYKNGAAYDSRFTRSISSTNSQSSITTLVDLNGTTDYIEPYFNLSNGSVSSAIFSASLQSPASASGGGGGSLTSDSVDGTHIQDGTITSADIAPNTVSVSNLDFASNEGINLPQQAVNPTLGTAGQTYYNTTTNKLMYHNGTEWVEVAVGGGTCQTIYNSCYAIKQADPAATDGVYTVDPDGQGGAHLPMTVYCNMTTSGGGWTLLSAATDGNYFTNADAQYFNATNPTPNSNKFSIMSYTDTFAGGGNGTTRAYLYLDRRTDGNRWVHVSQTNSINSSSVTGYSLVSYSHQPSTLLNGFGASINANSHWDGYISNWQFAVTQRSFYNPGGLVAGSWADGKSYTQPESVGFAFFVRGTTTSQYEYCSESAGDNLGNHTLYQNLKTNGKWISNDGDNEGIHISSTGNVGVGTVTPNATLDVNGSIRFGGRTIKRITMCKKSGTFAPSQHSPSFCYYDWTAVDCDNGLPQGNCVAYISKAVAGGPDTDWSTLTPGEVDPQSSRTFPNGGMNWWNTNGCVSAYHSIGAVYQCDN